MDSGNGAVKVRFKRVGAHANGLPLPRYVSQGAAGMDICAAPDADIVIGAGEWRLVPTGLAVELPLGYEAQVRPRSGLALRHGITLVNAPGTIDSDYRGEIGLIVLNLGKRPFTVQRGERIAQLVVSPVCRVQIELTAELEATERATGGFGHSGSDSELGCPEDKT